MIKRGTISRILRLIVVVLGVKSIMCLEETDFVIFIIAAVSTKLPHFLNCFVKIV